MFSAAVYLLLCTVRHPQFLTTKPLVTRNVLGGGPFTTQKHWQYIRHNGVAGVFTQVSVTAWLQVVHYPKICSLE